MKNSTALLVLIAVLILIGGFVLTNSKSSSGTGINTGNNQNIQKVVIGMKNYNYYPNTIKVKSGIPVEITLDESVYGCFRSFTIRDFGVSAYSKTPNEKITFTPNKKGTFRFSCSMGMGTGTIIVE